MAAFVVNYAGVTHSVEEGAAYRLVQEGYRLAESAEITAWYEQQGLPVPPEATRVPSVEQLQGQSVEWTEDFQRDIKAAQAAKQLAADRAERGSDQARVGLATREELDRTRQLAAPEQAILLAEQQKLATVDRRLAAAQGAQQEIAARYAAQAQQEPPTATTATPLAERHQAAQEAVAATTDEVQAVAALAHAQQVQADTARAEAAVAATKQAQAADAKAKAPGKSA